MNPILCYDWRYLARPEVHIVIPLTKLVRPRCLDIGLVLFLRSCGPRLRLGPFTRKKENGLLDFTLGQ